MLVRMQLRALAALLLVASSLAGCGGCAGSRGVILESRPDASFVTERAWFFASTAKGIEKIGLDGRERTVVFNTPEGSTQLSVWDTSPDQRTFLLGNQNTELFVGDATTGALRKVDVLGHRCSAAAFAPDGKRFAAARHSDYSLPQAPRRRTTPSTWWTRPRLP
jgi:hypothetical protein